MDKYKVDPEKLHNSYLKIKNIIEQIDEIAQSIYKDVDGLKDQWISSNLDKFNDIVKDETNAFKKINSDVLKYAKCLINVAQTYKETEKNMSDSFNGRKVNI